MSTITLEDALKKNSVTSCSSTDNVVLSYTDAATKKSGIKTVPASYLYNGSGSSSINISYLSDYIKYVNIFNNLAEVSGSSAYCMAYLSKITSKSVSITPNVVDMFSFRTTYNTETDSYMGQTGALLDRLYLAGKAGKYIDLSGTLKYFKNYDEYLANKSDIDKTYIGVVHGIKCIHETYLLNDSLNPIEGVNTYSKIQLAVGKLSDVFGIANNSPITLYRGYFYNISPDSDSSLLIEYSYNVANTAYKLIDYMHGSALAVSV